MSKIGNRDDEDAATPDDSLSESAIVNHVGSMNLGKLNRSGTNLKNPADGQLLIPKKRDINEVSPAKQVRFNSSV